MSKIIISKAELIDKERWDSYVERHPDASPYHLFAWKEAVEKAYGHEGYYLIAESNKSICGVLPVVHMKLPFMYNQMVALPFCDYGKSLVENNASYDQLIDKIISIAKNLNCELIEVRSQKEYSSMQDDMPIDRHFDKCRMILNLPESSDLLLSSFKSKLRSQVRKSEKNGLTFRWGHEGDLDSFYSVFSKNMLDMGSPVHSKKWFSEIIRCYGDNCRMGVVDISGETVGVGIILIVGDKVSIPWASTLREYNRYSPNMLLYWNFLKFASDNGFSVFDFGRSSIGSGTYKFKAQWGSKPVELDWYDINISGESRKDKSGNSSKRDIAARIWSKMPLQLANTMGPVIRRYISL